MRFYYLPSMLLGSLFALSALAGQFDKFTPKEIMSLPADTLEKIFLKENCPNIKCYFGYGAKNNSNLTLAQKLAVFNYTLGIFDSLNPALYKGRLTNDQLAFTRVFDSALAKMPSVKMTVYRGTSKKFDAKIGSVIEFKAYSSTSTDRIVAEGFVRDRLIILDVKTGKDIQEYSNAGHEREVLIPKGVNFKVEGVSFKEMLIGEDPTDLKRVKVEVVKMTEV
jgi:hypothetical protein